MSELVPFLELALDLECTRVVPLLVRQLPHQHVVDTPSGPLGIALEVDSRRLLLEPSANREVRVGVELGTEPHGEVTRAALMVGEVHDAPLGDEMAGSVEKRARPEGEFPPVASDSTARKSERQQGGAGLDQLPS